MHGYSGKILRLDLTKKNHRIEGLDSVIARKFVGGVGFGIKTIYREVSKDTSVFSPENIMVFSVGPLTATQWPASSSFLVCSKSPLISNLDMSANGWMDARAGGPFGPQLKASGFDAVILRGRAEEPTYVYIDDGRVRFESASHLWGHGTYETRRMITKDIGEPKAAVACIGPAGENCVRFASIVCTGDGVAGRGGLGAVMGSKNLKAIAVRGDNKAELADPDGFEQLIRRILPKILKHPHTQTLVNAGTAGFVIGNDAIGDTPQQNWRGGYWPEGSSKISGETFNKKYGRRRRTCPFCPIGCHRDVKIEKRIGPVEPFDAGGPEYETIGMLGSNNLVDDIEAVAASNHICNDYGLDTISTGGTVSFAFECYEKGILTKSDTDGLELTWGNGEALVWLVWKIARREGLGDLLAEGSLRAARNIGKGSEDFAIQVKGAELPAHDPRAWECLAACYAISNKGAHHLESLGYEFEWYMTDESLGIAKQYPRFGTEGKGRLAALGQDFVAAIESLGVCLMAALTVQFSDMWEGFRLATGLDMTMREFQASCERIVNLKRAFNCKCGFTARDDGLPNRIVTHARPSGESAGHLPNLEPMLEDYYKFRMWDMESGKPVKQKLVELGLEEVAGDLWE